MKTKISRNRQPCRCRSLPVVLSRTRRLCWRVRTGSLLWGAGDKVQTWWLHARFLKRLPDFSGTPFCGPSLPELDVVTFSHCHSFWQTGSGAFCGFKLHFSDRWWCGTLFRLPTAGRGSSRWNGCPRRHIFRVDCRCVHWRTLSSVDISERVCQPCACKHRLSLHPLITDLMEQSVWFRWVSIYRFIKSF